MDSITISTSPSVKSILDNLATAYTDEASLSITNDCLDTLVRGLSEFLTTGRKPDFDILNTLTVSEFTAINISRDLTRVFQIMNSMVLRQRYYNNRFKYRGLNAYNVVMEIE